MDETARTLHQIVSLAKSKRLVAITYQKSPVDKPLPRFIEPYTLVQGKQDIMLRAFQTNPEPGWRYFMLHKITKVTDTNIGFEPRRRFVFDTPIRAFEPYEEWTAAMSKYRNMVLSALSDMCIHPKERAGLTQFCEKHNLEHSDIHTIHAGVFLNCLTSVLADGMVDEKDRNHLREIEQCLQDCGCGILGNR